MEEDLKDLDAMFADIGGNEKAEEMANSFIGIEDGEYDAEVISAEFKKSKSDLLMIEIIYGLEGDKQHRQYLMFQNKDRDEKKTQQAISRSVTVLRKFGLDAQDITGYVSQLDKLVGMSVTLTLDTKNNFQNTHVEVK